MNLRNPIPSSGSHWMNDELPSPPKLCKNNMMAPIPQSLIRGSSPVALLPLHIREGVYETVLLSEIKEPENCLYCRLLRIFSVWHCFFVLFCLGIYFSPRLMNVSQKKWSSPSSGLDSHSSSECKLKETKALFCFVLLKPFAVWLLVYSPQTDPFPGERARCWTAAEI